MKKQEERRQQLSEMLTLTEYDDDQKNGCDDGHCHEHHVEVMLSSCLINIRMNHHGGQHESDRHPQLHTKYYFKLILLRLHLLS